MYKYMIILLLLIGCDTHLESSELEQHKDVCSKNDGIDYYKVIIVDKATNNDIVRITHVSCKDGALFRVYTRPE